MTAREWGGGEEGLRKERRIGDQAGWPYGPLMTIERTYFTFRDCSSFYLILLSISVTDLLLLLSSSSSFSIPFSFISSSSSSSSRSTRRWLPRRCSVVSCATRLFSTAPHWHRTRARTSPTRAIYAIKCLLSNAGSNNTCARTMGKGLTRVTLVPNPLATRLY